MLWPNPRVEFAGANEGNPLPRGEDMDIRVKDHDMPCIRNLAGQVEVARSQLLNTCPHMKCLLGV